MSLFSRIRDVLAGLPPSDAAAARTQSREVGARAREVAEKANATVAKASRFMEDVAQAERVADGGTQR